MDTKPAYDDQDPLVEEIFSGGTVHRRHARLWGS